MTSELDVKYDIIRQECWDRSLNAFGYGYIYGVRYNFYNAWVRVLTLLGIVVPLIIGTTVMGYGADSTVLKYLIFLSVPLSLLQVVISAFSLVNAWEDNASYSREACSDYNSLSDSYRKLAKHPPDNLTDLINDYEKLEIKFELRALSESKYLATDRERRLGMRWGLRQFRRACSCCELILTSMESTDCNVCGNFKQNQLKQYFSHG